MAPAAAAGTIPAWEQQAVPGRPGSTVTPEAVVLEVRTASLGSRAVARLVDLLVLIGAQSAISVPLALVHASGVVTGIVAAFVGVLAIFGYPAILEAVWKGRTVGKAATGLRVVSTLGGPIAPRQAIVRSILFPLDVVLGVASIVLSPRDRRIGDVLAGTVVRHERRAERDVTPTWFFPPPGLERYTADLDVADLRPEEIVVARSLLLRWPTLGASTRQGVAATVAGPLVARLRHPIPPGLPPELYLQCLLAARQCRDNGVPVAAGWTGPAGPGWGQPGWGPPAAR